MKIAVFHELSNGGARRAVLELSKRLKKNNNIDLYFVDGKETREERKFFNNTQFYKFVAKKWHGGDWKTRLYKDTIELYKLRKLHKKIASDIDKKRYDIVFVHPSKFTQAPYVLKFLKTRKIYYSQEALRMVYEPELSIENEIPMHKRLYERLVRFLRKRIDRANILSTDFIIANSKFTKENLKRAYNIDSKVSYLGVDTDFFKPERNKKDIDLLYIGGKGEIDGYNIVSAAVSLLPNVSAKFHFTDENWTSDLALKRLYNRSKIVVCLTKNEPFGLIPLEAAACGVPTVALNGGGYRETVIDGKTGFLVGDNDRELAAKIKYLLANEDRRDRVGSQARKNVESHWTWEASAKSLENILTNVPKVAKSKISIKTKMLILFAIFLFSVSLRVATLNQIGRTWDETEYVEPGYKLVELIKKGDFNNSYFYTTYNHPPLIKYLYGITAHFDVEKLANGSPLFKYDLTYSRILSAFVFSLGVIVTVLIGWKLFSPVVGVVSGLVLSMLPFSLGLSQLVTAESWKIFIYPIAIYVYILLLKKNSVRNIILAGIATGVALEIKQSNALLILILSTAFLFQYRAFSAKERVGFVKNRILTAIAVTAIAIIVFFLFWPQALFHIKEINEINQKTWAVQFSLRPWLITLSPPEVFFGRLMLTPNFYYIVYFFITVPVGILILFFAGIFKILKLKNLQYYVILLWFLVPFLMSFYSWRQHGLRYIIEIYPAIALISALGLNYFAGKFTRKEVNKVLFFVPVVIYLFIVLWNIKPYYLDYFNELAGGTGTVYKYNLFQTGWWGEGMREAGEYVNKNAPAGSKVGLAISPAHTLLRSDKFTYSSWSKDKNYDYVVVNHYHIIRDGFDDSLIRKYYDLVYQVKADGAALAYVYKKK